MEQPDITIRKAQRQDAPLIVDFNIAMALETEKKKLPLEKIRGGVESLFDHPEYGFYMIAELNGRVAGSLMVTYEWSDWRNGLFWWIQSVYVIHECRGKGIYREMYRTVKRLAAKKPGICGCRLYVEETNHTAQTVYRKLGMVETHYRLYEEIFEMPSGKF